MTDGIIQKVLRDCQCDGCIAGLNTLHNNERRRFKQELIEKIKQEITTYGEPLPREIIYKILMGDNK